MRRTSLLLVASIFVAFFSTPVLAISPSAVLVYGDKLAQPTLLRPASPEDFPAFGLLWWNAGSYARPTRTVQGDPQLLTELRNRPYVNLAIFWGRYEADEFKPENASQHGRFYPPTASAPAVVIVTAPDMQKKANPIPKELDGFRGAWTLSPQELSQVKGIGFPGI